MPVSRLRLRLAAGFVGVLAVTLGLFVTAGLWQQRREARQRFDDRLASLAVAVDHALVLQLEDAPTMSLRAAAAEVVRRWPHHGDAFTVLDSAGTPMATRDPLGLAPSVLALEHAATEDHFDVSRGGRDDQDAVDARALRHYAKLSSANGSRGRVDILAFDSTEGIERDLARLTDTLLVAAPLLILLSLTGGYFLTGRALTPMHRLGDAIDAIAPDDLSARLPTPRQQDEVSALSSRVNTLLERLEVVRRRHQRFVREAAHQIRTPLTLVLGEASHVLDRATDEHQSAVRALARVHLAAEQMRRRVDELLLFAEAESATTFRRDDEVELDELAFECTDLMRARAAMLGRTLALEELVPVSVRGNAALLREAVLEMLENACRHGSADSPVAVRTHRVGREAHLVVRSSLPGSADTTTAGTGLGVPILNWIASGHGGRFERGVVDGAYEARLVLEGA